MNKKELREHLQKVLVRKEAEGREPWLCFADDYLLAKDGTDEKNVQEIVSKAQQDSGLTFDFSYTIASDAVDILAELEDWNDEDAIAQAVDGAVPIYYHDIAKIYLANWGAVDEYRDEVGASTPSDCMKDAQGAWYNEIQKMVQAIKQGATELLRVYYLYSTDVCPSSLGEDDMPIDENETAHKWDTDHNPAICTECGATQV